MEYGYRELTDEAGRGSVYEVQNPQAVHRPERNDTVIGYRGEAADPFVTRFDHDTGTFDPPVRVGDNPLPLHDNHGTPSLAVDGDGYVYVFYGAHNTPIQVARSAGPEEFDTWRERTPIDDPGGSYPQPGFIEGDLYVFYRSGHGHGPPYEYPAHEYATIVRSGDGARSWSDLGPVVDTSGHPAEAIDVYVMDGDVYQDRFRLTWGIAHGDVHDEIRAHAFHAAFDPADDRLYGLDGTDFGRTVTWAEMDGSVLQAFRGQHANQPKHAFHDGRTHIVINHFDRDEDILPPDVEWDDVETRTDLIQYLDVDSVDRRVATWEPEAGTWSVETVPGAGTIHTFNACYPRINDAGALELHATTGGAEGRRTVRGGDFEVVTREPDGWHRRTVVSATENHDRHFSRVSTVRDGIDELASLVAEAEDDSETFDVSLFVCGTAF